MEERVYYLGISRDGLHHVMYDVIGFKNRKDVIVSSWRSWSAAMSALQIARNEYEKQIAESKRYLTR
jgi:hypothetical protein